MYAHGDCRLQVTYGSVQSRNSYFKLEHDSVPNRLNKLPLSKLCTQTTIGKRDRKEGLTV